MKSNQINNWINLKKAWQFDKKLKEFLLIILLIKNSRFLTRYNKLLTLNKNRE